MQQPAATKELILDTAESLFSEHGVQGVSLRMLTKEADVNVASVHYHFGSKEAVVRAAFQRRIRPVNRERLAMLDAIEGAAAGKAIAVEDVLTALFSPVMRLTEDPERHRQFMRLCARLYSEPADYCESVFKEEFAEVIARFERAFARALPDLAIGEVRQRMHFAVAVMVHTMLDCGRTHRWAEGGPSAFDSQEMLDSMVRFVAGGMRTPPGTGQAVAGEAPR